MQIYEMAKPKRGTSKKGGEIQLQGLERGVYKVADTERYEITNAAHGTHAHGRF